MKEPIFNDSPEDEFVVVFLPVCVKKKNINLPTMMPSPQLQQPMSVVSEEPTAMHSSRSYQQTEHKPRKGLASPKQIEFVEEIIDRLHMDKREAQEEIGSPINKMTNAQANKFINKYKDDKPESPF